jgi:OOP family OmpA-OmpF porin
MCPVLNATGKNGVTMKKFAIHIALLTALLCMSAAQAGQFGGGYFGAKVGANTSSAIDSTGTTIAPNQKSAAYFMQGGYLQGGYNFDLSAVVIGVGAYGDWNAYAKHNNGVAYGSRAFGFDAKLGVPLGNWMPYAKLGRGHSMGSGDYDAVAQRSPNTAFGFEYKLAAHWSTIGEIKTNKFTSQDGSITIKNRTTTIGLNYYFDEPPEPERIPEPEAAPEPEPTPVAELAPVPEAAPPVSEVWKTFLEDKPVRIEGTNFVVGSAKLKLVAGKELMKEVVEFVGKHPDANLEVIGYSDNKGSEKANKKLSLARAKAVKKYLVDTGIEADRITVKGEGSANPVGDNKTAEGRAQNRRVEIRSVVREEKKVLVAPATH